MALAGATVWEVRDTGNAANGGGFVAGATGTDRSQSDSPHVTFDGATITATSDATGTTLTLTGYTVQDPEDIGNILNITGGTDFTTGRYQITGVNEGANTWTVDRDSSSGAAPAAMTGRMGGAVIHPSILGAVWTAGNTMHVKAGTYLMSSTANVDGGRFSTALATGDGNRNRIIGYQTTRGDLGTKPVFQAQTNNSHSLVTNTGAFFYLDNIEFRPGAQTGIIAVTTSGLYFWARRLFVNGTAQGIVASGVGSRVEECEVTGCSAAGGIQMNTGNGLQVHRCHVHDCTTEGIDLTFTQGSLITGCIVETCAPGIILAANTRQSTVAHCTVLNCTGSGIQVQGPSNFVINCLSTGNTDWGLEGIAGNSPVIHFLNNATYDNDDGDHTQGQAEGHVTLTADPYINAAGGNYALNGVAGGGLAAKAAGLPTTFPGLATTTSAPDVGAVQTDVTSVMAGSNKKHHCARRVMS